MAEVVDTFELRHVSTTYSEDKDGNTLTHFNCRGNAAGFGLVYDTAILVFDLDGPKIRSVGELRLDTESPSGTNYSVDI